MTIDYDKLKEVHERVEKIRYAKLVHRFSEHDGHEFILYIEVVSTPFSNIDDLLTKLRELTEPEKPKPKLKYEVGQEVFVRHDTEIHSFVVDEIIEDDGFWYLSYLGETYWDESTSFDQYREDVLYPSRKALIDAQIEYWNCLYIEEISTHTDHMSMQPPFEGEIKGFGCAESIRKHHELEDVQESCQHEFENDFGKDPRTRIEKSRTPKCKKCGEFYR